MKFHQFILIFIFFSQLTTFYCWSQIASPIQMDGLSAWWCADSVKQEDGTPVLIWENLADVMTPVEQSIEENAPILKRSVSELNNHSVLRFDGNDYLDGGNILNVGKLGQTAFVIAKSIGVNGCFFAKSLSGLGNNRYYCMYENSKPTFLIQFTKNYFGPIGISRTNMYEQFSTEVDENMGTMSFYQNMIGLQKKETFQVAYNFTSSYNFLVGAYNNTSGTLPPNSSYFLNGDIAELIFYDRPLSNIERQSVENYLRSKYFPGTEREQFSLGNDTIVNYGLKPIELVVPIRDYFKTIAWSTGENLQSISVNKSGLYDVFVTDDWGYEYVDTISIDFPSIKMIQDQTICDGSSIIWDCGLIGDYSYLWSTGETTQAINISKAGKYAVKVTDNAGYSIVSDTVTIMIDDFPSMAKLGVDTTLCAGNSIGLVSGAFDVVEYKWSTGDTLPQITIQNSGVYSVEVTNKLGCVAKDEVVVAVIGTAPIARYVSQNHCEGNVTELLSNSYTTDNVAISHTSWIVENDTIDGFVQTHSFSHAGTFPVTLLVENEIGCVQILHDSITIHPKPIAQFSPKVACQYTTCDVSSTSTIASGTISSYQWESSKKMTNDSIFSFLSDYVTSYPLKLIVSSDYGCKDTINDNIVVRPSTKIEITHSKACIGDTVSIFDVTKYQDFNEKQDAYWLYDNKQISYYQALTSILKDTLLHPISLHVKTFNGCWNRTYDTLQARDLPRPIVKDTIWGCENSEIQLEDEGTSVDKISSYEWIIEGQISKEEHPIVEFKNVGTYTYSYMEETIEECKNSTSGVIIIEKTPKANFSFFPEYGAAPLEVEFTNISENASTYLWTFEQTEFDDSFEPTYTFIDKDNAVAKLQAFSTHGCEDSKIQMIPLQLSDLRLQITDIQTIKKDDKTQYIIQILNSGNDVIPEIEISLQSTDFPMLTETWKGSLKAGAVLTYEFNAKVSLQNDEIPQFVCATAKISSLSQNATYYSDEYCKDNTGNFILYQISPNPVKKEVQVLFSTKQNGDVTILCIDDCGKVRMKQTLKDLPIGFHTISLDVLSLPSSRYTVVLQQGNEKKQMAFMKIQ